MKFKQIINQYLLEIGLDSDKLASIISETWRNAFDLYCSVPLNKIAYINLP